MTTLLYHSPPRIFYSPQFVASEVSAFNRDVFVHLDLKGAPLKLGFLRQFFPLIRSWGATGILFEWEDMLPFAGRFEVVRSPDAYSEDQVKEILDMAGEHGLKVRHTLL